jgi:hypothetical protein
MEDYEYKSLTETIDKLKAENQKLTERIDNAMLYIRKHDTGLLIEGEINDILKLLKGELK